MFTVITHPFNCDSRVIFLLINAVASSPKVPVLPRQLLVDEYLCRMGRLDIKPGFAAEGILVILVGGSKQMPLSSVRYDGAVIAGHHLRVLVVGVVAHAPGLVQVLVHKVEPRPISQLNLLIAVFN